MLMAIILAIAAVVGFIAGTAMFGLTGGLLVAVAFPVAGFLLMVVLVIVLTGFTVASELIGQAIGWLNRWTRERISRKGPNGR